MYEIDKEKFGPFVAQLRKEKGLTQKQLAQALYVSDKAVSKWERSLSLPDTGLLLPLAQLLGVTVTELLLCEKSESPDPLPRGQVDQMVEIFARAEEKPPRSWREKSRWPFVMPAATLLGVLSWFFLPQLFKNEEIFSPLLTMQILCLVFGAYFCFLAPLRLPAVYDAYPMSIFVDGPVRMNLAGVHFNNQNWPHILRAARLSCCLLLVLLPLIAALLHLVFTGLLFGFVLMALFFAGIFAPLYAAARKK